MKAWLLTLAFASIALAGCLDGEADEDPVDEVVEEVQERRRAVDLLEPFVFPMEGGGQGLWIHDGLLYRTNGGDLQIVDVTDPHEAVLLGTLDGVGARDVDVLPWDGSLYAALAGSGDGMHLVDVSDPTDPVLVNTIQLPSAGVHNLVAVQGSPYIYSSGASPTRQIDVVDITDPEEMQVTTFDIPTEMNGVTLNSDGCHDITVRPDLGRAYCAGGGGQYQTGGGESFIWDISADPREPVWINFVDDPRVVYNHQAFVNDAGTILIVNDENIGPNCEAVDLPGPADRDETQVPFAAAWIWSIADESNPQQLGYIQNDAVTRHITAGEADRLINDANCGSHFGDMVAGTEQFVMGWYGGGTVLVDISNPEDPMVIDVVEAQGPSFDPTNPFSALARSTWDARYFDGYVYHASADLQITEVVFEELGRD